MCSLEPGHQNRVKNPSALSTTRNWGETVRATTIIEASPHLEEYETTESFRIPWGIKVDSCLEYWSFVRPHRWALPEFHVYRASRIRSGTMSGMRPSVVMKYKAAPHGRCAATGRANRALREHRTPSSSRQHNIEYHSDMVVGCS